MEKIIKSSMIHECPKTNKKIQFKMNCSDANYYVYSRDNYEGDTCYLRIYKCKSCGKEHEIELN